MRQSSKRHQVFISSTYEDLKVERQKVIEVVLELGCFPSGMEIFPAAAVDPWTLIQRIIDDCDYLVLIVKGHLGTVHEETQKSYTRMEYEYALSIGKPVFSFLHKDPLSLPQRMTERDEKRREMLDAFQQEVKKKVVKFWDGPNDLARRVSTSLNYAFHEYPAEGWVRPSSVSVAPSQDLDASQARSEPFELVEALREIFAGSRFGRRLTQGAEAKDALARYALSNGVWRNQDHTFVDSGTIPVYLVSHLLRSPQRDEVRPRKILTNNIPVGVLEIIEGGLDVDETQVPSLPKSPLNIELMGGVVMDNYAATLPGELIHSDIEDDYSKTVIDILARECIDHIILMTTRITAEDGPCTVNMPTRKHKRAMLRYALEHDARITLMAEAEKIVAHRDDGVSRQHWRKLIDRGRISLVCAFKDRPSQTSGATREQIDHMRSTGLEVIITGEQNGSR